MDALTSLELDDEEKLDAVMPLPMPHKPDFPFGMRICMTEKDFEKLKSELPSAEDVNATFTFKAMARITSVNCSADGGGEPCCRMEAQIEAMKMMDDESDE